MANLNLGNLIAGLKLDTKGFSDSIKGVTGKLQTLSGTLGSVLSVGAITAGLNAAIDKASDLGETANLIGVTFGKASPKVVAMAKAAASEVGRSQAQMLGFTASLGALIKPLTGSEQAAAQMAPTLAKLAVDMGSFFNAADTDVLTALKSGLTGEMEPLKRFGVVMSVAELQAFAMSRGITKSVSSMSEAEKVALRYQFILAKTADAQGDAARTADGLANKTKRFGGLVEDSMTLLGQVLLPVKNAILDFGIAAVGAMNALSPMTKTVGLVAIGVGVLGTALAAAAIAAAPFVAGMLSMLAPVVAVVAAVAGLVGLAGALKMAWDKNFLGVRDITAKVAEFIIKAWDYVVQALDRNFTAIRDGFITLWEVGHMAAARASQGIARVMGGLRTLIIKIFSSAMDFVLKVVQSKVMALASAMKAIGIVPKSLIDGMDAFEKKIGSARSKIRGLAVMAQAASDSYEKSQIAAGEATIKSVTALSAELRKNTIGTDLKAAIGKALAFIKQEGPGVAQAVMDGVKDSFGAAFDALPEPIKALIESIRKGFAGGLKIDVGTGGGGTGGKGTGTGAGATKYGEGGPSAKMLEEWMKSLKKLDVSKVAGETFSSWRELMGAARGLKEVFGELADKGKYAAMAFGQILVEGVQSSAGKFGKLLESAGSGAASGGLIGAIAGGTATLLTMSTQFEEMSGVLDSVVQGAADLLGTALAPLAPVLGALSVAFDAALGPMAELVGVLIDNLAPFAPVISLLGRSFGVILGVLNAALIPVLKLLNVAAQGFARVMYLGTKIIMNIVVGLTKYVINPLIVVVGKIMGFIFDAIASILETVSKIIPGKQEKLDAMAQSLRDSADSFKSAAISTEAAEEALKKMNKTTFNDAMAEAGDAAKGLATETRKVTSALTNVPQGFKVAVARFRAAEAATSGSVMTAMTTVGPTTTTGVDQGMNGGRGYSIYIENMLVQANDVDAFAAELEEVARTKRASKTGSGITFDMI